MISTNADWRQFQEGYFDTVNSILPHMRIPHAMNRKGKERFLSQIAGLPEHERKCIVWHVVGTIWTAPLTPQQEAAGERLVESLLEDWEDDDEWFHGGVPGLKVGDLILPARETGKGNAHVPVGTGSHDKVYISRSEATSQSYAVRRQDGGALYVVKPIGRLTADPVEVKCRELGVGFGPLVAACCDAAEVVEVVEEFEPVEQPSSSDETRLGSTEGGLRTDAKGRRIYVKFYSDPDQGRTEVLAANIYREMGIKTAEPELSTVDGRPAVVSRWNDRLEHIPKSDFRWLTDSQRAQLGRMFFAAVLTKNWDVIGDGFTNVMRHRRDRDLYSIDQGGAFHFRARGEAKPYGPDTDELRSLRDPSMPAGEVFGHLSQHHHAAMGVGFEAVRHLDMARVAEHFAASGLANADELLVNFDARRASLLNDLAKAA